MHKIHKSHSAIFWLILSCTTSHNQNPLLKLLPISRWTDDLPCFKTPQQYVHLGRRVRKRSRRTAPRLDSRNVSNAIITNMAIDEALTSNLASSPDFLRYQYIGEERFTKNGGGISGIKYWHKKSASLKYSYTECQRNLSLLQSVTHWNPSINMNHIWTQIR